MSKKIGRNDPCPCGNGKKYKKCCLNQQQSTPFENTGIRRLQYMLLELMTDKLMPFVRRWIPREKVVEIMDNFFCLKQPSVMMYSL